MKSEQSSSRIEFNDLFPSVHAAPEDRRLFWTITARDPQSAYDRGYAASRDDAMADFNDPLIEPAPVAGQVLDQVHHAWRQDVGGCGKDARQLAAPFHLARLILGTRQPKHGPD